MDLNDFQSIFFIFSFLENVSKIQEKKKKEKRKKKKEKRKNSKN
jgi:hypothetical protein